MSTAPLIDLDAAKREGAYPDGIPVKLGGDTFTLPGELPTEVLDPLLSEELDLVGIMQSILGEGAANEKAIGEAVIDRLVAQPTLPRDVVTAIYATFEALFGAEQYSAFKAKRPSIVDYLRLGKHLFPLYGVTLGEAFASAGSSESDGPTPKPTSNASTDSTPEVSGDAQDSPAS